MVEQAQSFDFFSLFIPSNPFRSMAENHVPAVVLFSVMCGAAIIGMSNKGGILRALDTMQEVLGRVTGCREAQSSWRLLHHRQRGGYDGLQGNGPHPGLHGADDRLHSGDQLPTCPGADPNADSFPHL
jgi:hypothetical protein